MNDDLAIDVDITTTSFTTTLNDDAQFYDSYIKPNISVKFNQSKIPASYFERQIVYAFTFSWDGNPNLLAGEYVSLEYVIN